MSNNVPNEDKYEKIIAIVNGGSGVFFQPNTKEYSYILTAKHTLYEDKETMKEPIKEHKLSLKGSNIKFIKKFEHDTLDIAILKIEKLDIITPLLGKLGDENLGYDLFGHPNDNRNDENTLDNFKLTANKTKKEEQLIIFDEKDYSGQEVIEGVSGGGIFKNFDNKIYLIAIEFEMNANIKVKKRRDRRIKAISVKAFDEIVDNYSDELVYLNKDKKEDVVKNKKRSNLKIDFYSGIER